MPLRCDMRFEKGENQKAELNPGQSHQNMLARDLPSELLKLMCYINSAVICAIPPMLMCYIESAVICVIPPIYLD